MYGWVFALPQPLGGAIFSGSDTRSVYGRATSTGLRHNHQTLGATCLSPPKQSNGRTAIRPFTIETPEADLDDLRARVVATRFPEKETVEDSSQGPRLATMQALARYWAEDYDWSKCEEKLKALPHFITEIDGLDIHFIHVRSDHEDALPLLVAHGWPGSIIEQLKIIDPLTNPTAKGASAADAFHLVIPSMPGYGFSGKPTETGWGPEHIARAWAELMKRLGYDRYVATGGDWGGQIVDLMGAQAPPGLIGIHTNFPGAVRPDVAAAVQSGGPAPPGLNDEETRLYDKLADFLRQTWATQSSWGPTHRRCTGSRIHPSAWPPGCSTTTRLVWR